MGQGSGVSIPSTEKFNQKLRKQPPPTTTTPKNGTKAGEGNSPRLKKMALDNERKESAGLGKTENGMQPKNITSRVADTFEGFDNTSDFRRDGFP